MVKLTFQSLRTPLIALESARVRAGPTVVYFPNWEARSGRIFLDVYKRCSPSKRYILKIPEPNRIESNNSGKTDGFVQFMFLDRGVFLGKVLVSKVGGFDGLSGLTNVAGGLDLGIPNLGGSRMDGFCVSSRNKGGLCLHGWEYWVDVGAR